MPPLSDGDIAAATWWPPLRLDSGSDAALSGGAGPSGASVLLAALQALQEAGERVIMSAMVSKVGVAMARAKSQNWELETPPRSSGAVSPWMEQLLGALQVRALKPLSPQLCPGSAQAALADSVSAGGTRYHAPGPI